MSELLLRKQMALWITPPVPEKDETVLKILGYQNKELNPQNWKLVFSAASQIDKGKDFIFTLPDEMTKLLRKSNGSIKFGLGLLKTRLPNDKTSEDPTRATGGSD